MKNLFNRERKNRSYIDPSIRFNLSVSDRITAFPKEFLENAKYLNDLFEQKKVAELVRDRVLKSLALLISLLFLAINGSDLALPTYLVNLSEIPSVIEILLCLCSFTFVICSIKFHDVNSYVAVIDNVLTDKFGDDLLSKHMYKMAHSNETSIFLTLANKYLANYQETFQRGLRARLFASFLLVLLVLILMLFLLMPAALIAFVALSVVPKTPIGWVITSFALVCILFSIFTMFMLIVRLPHDVIIKQ